MSASRALHSSVSLLALAGSTLLLSACGGGGGDASDASATEASGVTASTASATPTMHAEATTVTLQQRIDAAKAAVSGNAICKSLHPFYWEVGDKTGAKVSGTGGDKSVAPPTATTAMQIASASKWIMATYAVQKRQGALSTSDIKLLNFTSGYSNLNTCSMSDTVSSCLSGPGLKGGYAGDYIAANDGMFVYNSGHLQVLADHIGLGPLSLVALGTQVQTVIGTDVPIKYAIPLMAGGIKSTPAAYAQFLRNMLGTRYPYMRDMLGKNAVCTFTNAANCPAPGAAPTKLQKAVVAAGEVGEVGWHYSMGHWVEDEPGTGDGAFSSPGKGGFYPWIDKSKTYYGLVTSIDSVTTTNFSRNPANQDPNGCGHAIRQAYINPVAPI
jgi:hypothetical protein